MQALLTDITHGTITQRFAGSAPEALAMNGKVSRNLPSHSFKSPFALAILGV